MSYSEYEWSEKRKIKIQYERKRKEEREILKNVISDEESGEIFHSCWCSPSDFFLFPSLVFIQLQVLGRSSNFWQHCLYVLSLRVLLLWSRGWCLWVWPVGRYCSVFWENCGCIPPASVPPVLVCSSLCLIMYGFCLNGCPFHCGAGGQSVLKMSTLSCLA